MSYEAMVKESTGYEAADLNRAFNLVRPASNWKDPIEAVIPVNQKEIVAAAIEFYTATKPVFSPFLIDRYASKPVPEGFVRVVAAGYRRGPAGDH